MGIAQERPLEHWMVKGLPLSREELPSQRGNMEQTLVFTPYCAKRLHRSKKNNRYTMRKLHE
eukprot:3253641-Amphidinium_carterae.1